MGFAAYFRKSPFSHLPCHPASRCFCGSRYRFLIVPCFRRTASCKQHSACKHDTQQSSDTFSFHTVILRFINNKNSISALQSLHITPQNISDKKDKGQSWVRNYHHACSNISVCLYISARSVIPAREASGWLEIRIFFSTSCS